jgi:hypothetical protein
VLAHLTSPTEDADEEGATAARAAVERYMATVDVSSDVWEARLRKASRAGLL